MAIIVLVRAELERGELRNVCVFGGGERRRRAWT
jgi:hypothetical protein